MDMVDQKQIAFNPAVELSYLKPEEQADFLQAIDETQTAPSLSQAQRIKKLSQEGTCTQDAIVDVMSEAKKPEIGKLTFSTDSLRKYFPKSYTAKQMEETIIRLLEQYMKKRQRDMER
jgi:ParB family transcriptional regulator, chromosome partitioning protein